MTLVLDRQNVNSFDELLDLRCSSPIYDCSSDWFRGYRLFPGRILFSQFLSFPVSFL